MLAVVTIVVLTSIIVVHFYQMTLNCVIEVVSAREHIRAKENSVFIIDERAFQKLIARVQVNCLRLENNVISEQLVGDGGPELVLFECL